MTRQTQTYVGARRSAWRRRVHRLSLSLPRISLYNSRRTRSISSSGSGMADLAENHEANRPSSNVDGTTTWSSRAAPGSWLLPLTISLGVPLGRRDRRNSLRSWGALPRMMGKPSVCEATPDQALASDCAPYTHAIHICKENCCMCLSWRLPDLWFVSHGFVPGSRLSSAWVRPRGAAPVGSPRSCISRGSSRKNVRAPARGLSARAVYHGEPEVRPGRGLAEGGALAPTSGADGRTHHRVAPAGTALCMWFVSQFGGCGDCRVLG